MARIPGSERTSITEIELSIDGAAESEAQSASEEPLETPSQPRTCTAHFRVRCATSLPREVRKKMLERMRQVVMLHDPTCEHRRWSLPMTNVPPELQARKLAMWIRENLFMRGGQEIIALEASADAATMDVYYYVWDEFTQRWYLVCEHILQLYEYDRETRTRGNPVRFEFDEAYPDAQLEIAVCYRPGKPYKLP